ncbi:MAG: carbohydrate-binding protein, partial [Faecalibacterium sp.]
DKRTCYSPKSFAGECHLLRARTATKEECSARRNLALNPFDLPGEHGFFPHASANIETRGEAIFAARNAVDGIFENSSHGEWPYQSWGINRDPQAELRVDFGRKVLVDELRLTLRADFPHDSWWDQVTAEFSDGSRETFEPVCTAQPQSFQFTARAVEWIVLKELKKAPDASPFPALTQFEAWGCEME